MLNGGGATSQSDVVARVAEWVTIGMACVAALVGGYYLYNMLQESLKEVDNEQYVDASTEVLADD